MKKAIRPFLLGRILATQTGSHFAGKCSSLPIAALALAVLSAPYALAQSNSGTSVHSKTVPSNPPAAAPQPAEPQPAPQQPAAAPQAAPPQAAAPAPAAPQAAPAAQAAAPAPNAVGAGGGWDAQFGVAPPQTSQFTAAPEQVEIIQKINAYFNELKNLEGDFLQTDADDKRKKGKFYIERPGKVRFDYSLPSKQKIISNGKYLAIEDHDLNTTDRYPLEFDALQAVADQGSGFDEGRQHHRARRGRQRRRGDAFRTRKRAMAVRSGCFSIGRSFSSKSGSFPTRKDLTLASSLPRCI